MGVSHNNTMLVRLTGGFFFLQPLGGDASPKEHHELKSYVTHLLVIDSQQALFELSHRIEPRA